MRTAEQIQAEIDVLEAKMNTVAGHRTEVYSRIVGYYRSVANWNRGKREEYEHRTVFDQPGTLPAPDGIQVKSDVNEKPASPTVAGVPGSFIMFQRDDCPNCPPMKLVMENAGIEGSVVSVDDDDTSQAVEYGVYSVPTVVFLDPDGNELYRTGAPADAKEYIRESVSLTATA